MQGRCQIEPIGLAADDPYGPLRLLPFTVSDRNLTLNANPDRIPCAWIARLINRSGHALMKPPSKLVLLAALLLPGGVLLLLVPPVKIMWQFGVQRLSKKPV
jgi:hypothetical protein